MPYSSRKSRIKVLEKSIQPSRKGFLEKASSMKTWFCLGKWSPSQLCVDESPTTTLPHSAVPVYLRVWIHALR